MVYPRRLSACSGRKRLRIPAHYLESESARDPRGTGVSPVTTRHHRQDADATSPQASRLRPINSTLLLRLRHRRRSCRGSPQGLTQRFTGLPEGLTQPLGRLLGLEQGGRQSSRRELRLQRITLTRKIRGLFRSPRFAQLRDLTVESRKKIVDAIRRRLTRIPRIRADLALQGLNRVARRIAARDQKRGQHDKQNACLHDFMAR